jgi:alpha-L-rhamnosidase
MKGRLDPPAIRRVILSTDQSEPRHPWNPIWRRGRWLAKWLVVPAGLRAPFVVGYRLGFDLKESATIRVHLSADERALFLVDGQSVRALPERGDSNHWRFASYDLDLSAGRHWLALQLWCGGDRAPMNQLSAAPGVILSADDPWHDLVATGFAAWECCHLPAFGFDVEQPLGFFTGARSVIDAATMPWGWETGAGKNFSLAESGRQGFTPTSVTDQYPPILVAERLPAMTHEKVPNGTAVFLDDAALKEHVSPVLDPARDQALERQTWQRFLDGQALLTIPPRTQRRCLVDLGIYRSVWPRLRASGAGATVALRFAEGIYAKPQGDPNGGNDKGDRRRWEGKYLRGVGPAFLPAAGPARDFLPVEWECGRWLEITVTTAEAPLVVEQLELYATGFPFTDEGSCQTDDPRQSVLRDLCLHTMRVGTHETYYDCPYYERLQYVGDTRLEVLTTYCLMRDDGLPKQAIDAFADSRLENGLVPSRAPARGVQIIPPFALWWIHMVHDHALWRDDPSYSRRHLPGIRAILDAWSQCQNASGLIESPPGWNFVDWVSGWDAGIPVGANGGFSAILNWHFAWTLRIAAELEDALGESQVAALQRKRAAAVVSALECCWDAKRRRWSDAPGVETSSEHVQILAVLSGFLSPERVAEAARSLSQDQDLARTTIYFTHYLFEAYSALNRPDLLFQRLDLWFDLSQRGLTTTPECPEPTRSDCHPWGAHPLYHQIASIAGIRPAALGFSLASIRPQLGPLKKMQATAPHPLGRIDLSLERRGDRLYGTLQSPVPCDTPAGPLHGGRHSINWQVS